MPLTYSPNLKLTLIGDGEQTGTWGQLTNTNLGTLIEQAIAGYTTVSITDANYTLTSINGASDEARSMALNITSSVTLTATRNVICPSVSKLYVVKNATTGGQSIVIKTSAGTGITIANGATAIVLCDGTNVIDPFSGKVSTTGATMTGQLTLPGGGSGSQAATVSQITAAQAGAVAKAGDTMVGALTAPNLTANGGAYVAQNSSSGYVFFGTLGATPYGVNYDRFEIGIDSGAQKCYIGTSNGGTGLFRETHITAGGVSRIQVTSGGFILLNASNVTVAVIDNSGNLSVKGNVTAYAAI
jgi:hypothetical protein